MSQEPREVLGSGYEPDRRRRIVFAVVLVLLIAMAVPAWYADHGRRETEFTGLSQCAQQAQAAYDESTRQIAAMAEYVRPSLVFATEPTQRGLYGMVAQEASEMDDGLQQARDTCAGIEVLRWHPALRTALRARLAYVDAQLTLLAAVSTDGQIYFQDRSQLKDLGATAAAALTTAKPGLPW